MRFSTKAIHVGQSPDPTTGATIPPIYATSTYTQESPGVHKGYEYSRTDNPTRHNLEECLAALEGGAAGAAFSSGLAASSALLSASLRPGDSVVAYSDLYGGTYRLLEQVFKPWGLVPRYTDSTDPAQVAALVDETTKMVWLESPTNPMLRLLDIAGVVKAVREKEPRMGGSENRQTRVPPHSAENAGILVVVDNTFATPALQLPLTLGADVVLHSTTKYMGGHSDVVGGAVITARPATMVPIRFYQNAVGAVPGPFDCFLVQRGLKTLALRMERHCANAQRIAEWASTQRAFEKVIYPGLPAHPQHELARRQMTGGGGMLSCVLAGGLAAARSLMSRTKIFACAESLGGVESLINHPAIMTHASMPPAVRQRVGIVDGLVRLSVGLEDIDDLIADLSAALG
jgi:cystathionine gamma-lyase